MRIYVIDDGKTSEVRFSPSLFDYDESGVEPDSMPKDPGFAKFRLRYPMDEPGQLKQFISFPGAGYFREIGATEFYGASARGLAVGMGEPNEEFSFFDSA